MSNEAKKKEQPTKNGMKRPGEGGKTRAIWDICDALKSQLKRTPTRGEVLENAPRGSNKNMVATQYGYWRRFNGITGYVGLPKADKPAKAAKPAKKGAKAKKPAPPATKPKPPAPKPAAPKPPAPPAPAPSAS